MPDSAGLTSGRQALLAGDFVKACGELEAALANTTQPAECLFLLGVARHRLHEATAARDAFQRVVALDPQHLQSRLALAAVCLDLEDATAAADACLDCSRIAPHNPEPWFSLGVAHEAGNSPAAALQAYDRALSLAPAHAGALKNRRALLLATGNPDEAIAQCRVMVAKQPFSLEAQFELAETLTAARQFTEAARVFGRATRLAPQSARVALHYGFALAQLERYSEAQEQLDRAAHIDVSVVRTYRQSIFGVENGDAATAPPRLDARTLFLLRHFDQIERCDWTERDLFIDRFSTMLAANTRPSLDERALGFRAMVMGIHPALQLNLGRQIACGIEALIPDKSQAPFHSIRNNNPNRRVRIAYLSADYRYHPTALLLGDMFSWHDRDRFEVTCYSVGPDDGSEQRQRVAASCDDFVDLAERSDDEAAQQIASDEIDVLIDLMGYTSYSRPGIPARRPAPVQVSWLAYVATTGAPWMDYVIADPISLPSSLMPTYSEATIHLPLGASLCAYAGLQLPPSPDQASLGLPSNALVLGAMHNHYKIDPVVFAIWMRLLTANGKAILWLLDCEEATKHALRASAQGHGVSPERLVFAPKISHHEHLVRLQAVDLVLDTPQCNGSTTTADALAAGVPVLTCAGSTFIQRAAASYLNAAGMSDLITYDLAQYETLALDLLLTPGRLAVVRDRISMARATKLFYSPMKWVRYFEAGIQRAWERHCANLPPETIEVEA